MTLATATIDTFTTVTSALTPITETPVSRNPNTAEANRAGTYYDNLLYVTRVESTDIDAERVGTVVKVAPSPATDGWFFERPNGNLGRVYGAVLNEPMVDGHYYRQLGGRNLLVRYNDEDHRGDRNVATLPLSPLAEAGAPWPFPNDGMGMWDNTPYIEVVEPALTPAPAEPTDAHQFVEDISATGRTYGFAQAEEDGRVRLNPDLEAGEMYLFWSPNLPRGASVMTEVRLVLAVAAGDEPATFAHIGYYTMERVGGEEVPYFYSNRRTVLDSSTDKAWAKLALAAAAEPVHTDAAQYRTTLTTERAGFAEFNDATNTLANDHDWCSEYDDIVTAVGMEGRTKSLNDYYVTVSADFSFSVDDVSSSMDREIANHYDVPGFSGSRATFTGTASVDIFVSEQESEEDARDNVGTSEIEEALSNMMSYADDIDVDDYSIRSSRMAD